MCILRGKLQEGGALVLSDDRTVSAASKDDPYRYLGIEQVMSLPSRLSRKTGY